MLLFWISLRVEQLIRESCTESQDHGEIRPKAVGRKVREGETREQKRNDKFKSGAKIVPQSQYKLGDEGTFRNELTNEHTLEKKTHPEKRSSARCRRRRRNGGRRARKGPILPNLAGATPVFLRHGLNRQSARAVLCLVARSRVQLCVALFFCARGYCSVTSPKPSTGDCTVFIGLHFETRLRTCAR